MKYDREYAEVYAALWAFGYETMHIGGTEGLYRSVMQLVVAACDTTAPIILDYGCGVGRSVRDCSQYVPSARVFGCDASPAMIEVAERLLHNDGREFTTDLTSRGFGIVRLPTSHRRNVSLWANISPSDDRLRALIGKCDIVLTVNTLERTVDPGQYLKSVGALLAPGGSLVLATCRNWQHSAEWDMFNSAGALVRTIESLCRVKVTEHFGDLPYKEVVDANGACETFNATVMSGRRCYDGE